MAKGKNVSWVTVAGLFANMIFSSWYLLVGGSLALKGKLSFVILSLFIGNVLMVFIFYFLGKIGKDLKLPTYEILKRSFGEYGSRYLVSALLVLARIGWVGVRTQLGGLALASIFHINNILGIFVYVSLFIIVTIVGFSYLALFGWLALMGTLLLSFNGLQAVFKNYGLDQLFQYSPSLSLSLAMTINLVIISKISFAAIVPDFFRQLKDNRSVLLASILGVLPAALTAGTVGAILTIKTGSYDLVEILQRLQMPLLAYGFLAISSLAPATLYPAGVGIASIIGRPNEAIRKIATVFAGLLGGFIALSGIVGYYTSFLNLLGIFFAPVAGIMIGEYYFLRKKAPRKAFPAFDWIGITSWLIGSLIVYFTTKLSFLIPSFNGLVISLLTFVFLKNLPRSTPGVHGG